MMDSPTQSERKRSNEYAERTQQARARVWYSFVVLLAMQIILTAVISLFLSHQAQTQAHRAAQGTARLAAQQLCPIWAVFLDYYALHPPQDEASKLLEQRLQAYNDLVGCLSQPSPVPSSS